MQKTLHPRILDMKRRASPISYRDLAVNDAGVLEERESLLDQRVVQGYVVIWGKRNLHGEIFIKGCFAKSIRENGPGSGSKYQIKFLYNHNTDEPLSLFAELTEDEQGLYFRTVPLDDVPIADTTLTRLRSGTLNNFSQGFLPYWEAGKVEWDDATESIVYKEANLLEISVATIPSGMDTYAIRTADQMEELYDETEDFINTLPRRQQLVARQLFSRHKSLADTEPPEQRAKALSQRSEPVPAGIDYDYLIKNFNI